MGSLIRGILVGLGLGFLIAPMRGQEFRRLISQRFQELRNALPEGSQVNQYTQQIAQTTTQAASTLKDYAQQATAQVKETASNLGDIAQQAGASAKDTASNLGTIAQSAGSDAKDAASDLASKTQDTVQQAASNVTSTASNLGNKAQDVAQQAATTAKNVASNAANTAQTTAQQTASTAKDVASNVTSTAQKTAQQTVSNAQNTASNVADATQKTASNVADTTQKVASTARDTAKSAASTTQSSLQNVQPATSSATVTGNSLSTIPGIEPEIQSKLEAQGITTTQQLLDQTSTKDERTTLSQSAAVSTQMLKTLSDRADLMRIQGVNADVATMLEEAGVAGSKDLRRRNPENLHATLEEERTTGNNAYSVPSVDQLTQWIADAMALTSSTQE